MRERKILFLNPPSFNGFDGGAGARYQARREIRSFWYPTWLASASAMAPGSRVLDAPPAGLTIEQVAHEAKGYDLVLLHTSAATVTGDILAAEYLKREYPEIVIGFAGPHVTVLPEATLSRSRSVDFVALGEYDQTAGDLQRGLPLDAVPGIIFRKNDSLLRTAARPMIENIDTLPFIAPVYARDLKVERYYNGYLRHPYLSLYTGRGCRGRCTFCLWPQTFTGHRYRCKSAARISEELTSAKQLFPQVKEFFFDDDTFSDHPDIDQVARLIGKTGVVWSCNARATLTGRRLDLLRENGLRLLTVGFESGNQTILNNIRKGITVEGARAFAKAAKKAGVLVHATFILGLPGETKETMEQTLRFALDIDPFSLQVSLAAPYPGTELYEQARREGWLRHEETALVTDGIQNAVLEYDHLSSGDMFEMVARFYRKFYFRPGPILNILNEMIRDGSEFRRRIREGVEFLTFFVRRGEKGA